ncbi:MAG TPA: hypothetical protein VE093_03400 [Polyangiaceae bacterium]|jgi:hypothetical protein|nr:hypothetical protein [Polyangiaceae bacterium]
MVDINASSTAMRPQATRPDRRRLGALLAALAALGTIAAMAVSCEQSDALGPPSGVEGSGSSGSGGTDGGGPCVDGATEECHVKVGQNGDVLTCLQGHRTCKDGAWEPCAGELFSRLIPKTDPAAGSDLDSSQALLKSDAGPCANNPCDPSCAGYAEEPEGGITLTPFIVDYFYQGTLADAIALTPPGFIDKGMVTPCSTVNDCQFDFHCVANGVNGVKCPSGAAKCCVGYTPLEVDQKCPKPDITTSFACTLNNVPTVPVCNRGTVTAPAGITIYIFPGNSPQYPTCTPDNNPGVCQTSAPIPPGKCVNVTGCPGLVGNGTKTVMVNPQKLPNGMPNPTWKDECYCGNNWSVWSGNATPCIQSPNYDVQPATYSTTYQGVCPAGTRLQWSYLTWDAKTAGDSNVVFEARSATTQAGLANVAFTSLGTAKALPLPNTEKCSVAGPAPCPISVFNALGGEPGASNEFLELRITLNPSANKTSLPVLNSWQVAYSCPPSE